MSMESLLKLIMEAIVERNRYFTEEPLIPKASGGATGAQLSDLETHWGIKLPPSYRAALAVHNGITNFYFDVPLLSTQQIINDTNESKTFQEFFPALWRYIFACGTGSYDAICFDRSQPAPSGEMPVVRLDDHGEAERWPQFDVFLNEYLQRLSQQIADEKANRQNLPE
jgi:hypothetical protein